MKPDIGFIFGIIMQLLRADRRDKALMRHKCMKTADCPVARTLDLVGEWWTLLILRDALRG